MARARAYRWEFTRRFRRGAFGWKSQPAIERVKQAVSEIRAVARHDPVLAAEGAVSFPERLWEAHERDEVPYIEILGDYWGELCGSPEVPRPGPIA